MPIVINGGSRSAGGWWAKHLDNRDKNDRVELVEISGLSAETMPDAFREMQAVAAATRCKNYFYQANINPRAEEHLTPEQWMTAVDALEKNLGLTGQPRIVVEHEKEGRTHRHVVWSRIDPERMVAISDSLTAAIHERTSRELELTFDLEQGRSILVRDREFERPERRPKKWEMFRGQETGIDPREVAALLKDLWQRTDSGRSFVTAIEEHGYILAAGDRRNFLVVDHAGDEHSLARRLGIKGAQVNERLNDIDQSQLPRVAEARALQRKNHRAETSLEDQHFDRDAANMAWEEKVAEAGIAHDRERQSERSASSDNGTRIGTDPRPERPLGKMGGDIRTFWNLTRGAKEDLRRCNDEFETALAARGITLAQVTPEEARESERLAAFARATGNFARTYLEGEIVAVNLRGQICRFDERTTGDDRAEITERLAEFDPATLLSVAAGLAAMLEAAEIIRKDEQRVWRDMNAPRTAVEARIADMLTRTSTGTEFAAALDEAGLTIARAVASDITGLESLRKEADLAAMVARSEATVNSDPNARHFGQLVEDECAAVTRLGDVIRLNPFRLDFDDIQERLADTQKQMPSIVQARSVNETVRERATEDRLQRQSDAAERATARFEGRQGEQAFRDVLGSVQRALRGGIDKTSGVTERAVIATRKLLDGATKIVESLIGFAAGLFGGGEPKMTRQQLKDYLRAEGNLETLHAHEVAHAAREDEAAYEDRWQAAKKSQQETDLGLSFRFGTPPTREANLGREYDDDRDRDRDRDR